MEQICIVYYVYGQNLLLLIVFHMHAVKPHHLKLDVVDKNLGGIENPKYDNRLRLSTPFLFFVCIPFKSTYFSLILWCHHCLWGVSNQHIGHWKNLYPYKTIWPRSSVACQGAQMSYAYKTVMDHKC